MAAFERIVFEVMAARVVFIRVALQTRRKKGLVWELRSTVLTAFTSC